jgi:hypothetical protein
MADTHPRSSTAPPAGLFPLLLVAAGLLALNDHFLKARWPGLVTGKLSDAAGCFALPLLVSAVLGLATRWSLRARLALGAFATVGLFSAIKLSQVAADAVAGWLATLTNGPSRILADPTDLAALPFVGLAFWYGVFAGEGPAPRRRLAQAGRLALLAATVTVLTATSRVRYCKPDRFAGTRLRSETDCGPPGDVTLRVSQSCRVSLEGADAVGLPGRGDRSDVPGEGGTIHLGGEGPLAGVTAPPGHVQHNSCTMTPEGELLRAECRSVVSRTPATGPFEVIRACRGILRPLDPMPAVSPDR